MKALVVYDSFFGNTEQIAQEIAKSLSGEMEVQSCKVGDIQPGQLAGLDLLVIGSPTRAFRPSPAIQAFLKALQPPSLQGVRVAAFDTRISQEDTTSNVLRFFIKLFGYAAKPIAASLEKKGGKLVVPPEGFCVKDSEGPLKDGELERAGQWGKAIRF